MGYVSKYVRENIFAPHPEHEEKRFLDLLVSVIKRYDRCVVIPADDATLVTVSRHKTELEKQAIIQCTSWDVTQKFLDKKYTYALAEQHGIPAPKTIVPQSAEEVRRSANTIQLPCLVKPCYSHHYFEKFKKKMAEVHTVEQMVAEYQRATDAGVEVMIQELITGDDTLGINYNSYFVDGEPLIEFTAEKVRLSPPSYGIPCVVRSREAIPEVLEYGRKILRALNFEGYSCTEFKWDARDGKYKLMEVNGRHNRSGLLSVRCGINFPWIAYMHDTALKPPDVDSYSTGIYWIDEFKDISTTTKRVVMGRYSPVRFIIPYFRPHIYAVFDWHDLRPFLKRVVNGLTLIFSSTIKILFHNKGT